MHSLPDCRVQAQPIDAHRIGHVATSAVIRSARQSASVSPSPVRLEDFPLSTTTRSANASWAFERSQLGKDLYLGLALHLPLKAQPAAQEDSHQA